MGEASAERAEVDGFLEISGSAELLAVILGLSASFAADDNNGDLLRVTESGEGLKEFVAGIIGHAEIQQDGVGFVLESESETFLRLARVNDFKEVAQFNTHEASNGLVIVHNQELVHREVTPTYPREC